MRLEIERHCICGSRLADASQLRALRHEFPGVVQWGLAVLSAKENHVAQCGQMDHACTFARWRRLRRKHLFPIATRRKPSPCSVLVYATASAAENNHCVDAGIESGRGCVHQRRLSYRRLQSPCVTTISPGVVRIDVAETTKQHDLIDSRICGDRCGGACIWNRRRS